jgi:hypothetical protein
MKLRTGHGRNHSHIGHFVPPRPFPRVIFIREIVDTNQLLSISTLHAQCIAVVSSRRLTIFESPSSLVRCSRGERSLPGMMALQRPSENHEAQYL